MKYFLVVVAVVVCVLTLTGLLMNVISPDISDTEYGNLQVCEFVALGKYSDKVVEFRLQRCEVPDGVCYVTDAGGLFCKWDEE